MQRIRRISFFCLLSILLLSCLTGLSEADEARSLALGDWGEDVREVQTHLKRLGYYTGSLSGNFGENTAQALMAFQKDADMEVNGIADPEVQTLLAQTLYRPLYLGISGTDVNRLQTRLALLGYYTGTISGTYLDQTRDAVTAFQVKMGLIPTGFADTMTQTLLFSSDAIARSGTGLATPAPAEEEVIDGNKEESIVDESRIPFVKKQQYGSSGKYVTQIQERMRDLGYYEGNISGSFQGHTRNAVKAFQTRNGLNADGVVGQETWDALFNLSDVAGVDDPPRVITAQSAPAFHIVVDVTNQAVTVYARSLTGEYDIVVKQMLCSTGTKENPSDIGDFVLSGRKARWCYFPKWGDYAQYWTKINGGIAFHSVIYREVNTQSLSLKSYRKLGSRASHGCIRLQVADAKWIYDNVEAGTVVTITDSLPADPELKSSLVKPDLNRTNMLPVATPYPTEKPVYISGAVPPQSLTAMRTGDSGENVYWLQCKLTELGYYTGTCSGTYLAGTEKAVSAFQKAMSIRVTGIADKDTLSVLYASELQTVAPRATAVPTLSPTEEPEETPATLIEEETDEVPVVLIEEEPDDDPAPLIEEEDDDPLTPVPSDPLA